MLINVLWRFFFEEGMWARGMLNQPPNTLLVAVYFIQTFPGSSKDNLYKDP